MLGWINDCVEKLVLAKFDLDAWHSIKEKAGCKVEDGGFYKLDPYPDQTTVDLVMAAVEVSGLSAEAILETFGAFFVEYVRDEGYDNLLRCQGSNLKDFMANINAMHQHLQDTFPNKMTMPQFWVEDDESGDGAIILHYHSKRGSLLAPVAKGVVCQVASDQFGYEIKMERLRTQGEEGAEQTSWKISTVDPDNLWKLTMRAECKQMNATYQAKQMKCPFTGMTTAPSQSANRRLSQTINTASVPSVIEVNEADIRRPRKRAKFSSNQPSSLPTSEQPSNEDMFFDSKEIEEGDPVVKKAPSLENTSVTAPLSIEEELSSEPVSDSAIGLSGRVTRSLFPYHIMVDLDLKIAQVGNKMPTVMQLSEDDFVGRCISEFLVVTKPVGIQWSWKWLRLLEDQAFDVQTVEHSSERPALKFKTTVVHVTEGSSLAMLVLTPDANNLQELREMKMTFSDLPLHGAHRESILLREHLSSQINSAAKMEQLSHSLEQEKTLLESMLPAHAAEGLRQGKTVEPRLHKNVTLFFSDIVNFTNMCHRLYPWQVIEMLNRLYCVMDFLGERYGIFKIETIGDAYVCSCGLPQEDEQHFMKVAHFAIAVNHCCRHVVSPVDGSPLQLRIGIHSGSCASGVVGTKRPQYCVFGDTVNTTARHESTGEPGKVQCSSTTRALLESHCKGSFVLKERGLVSMKGKGDMKTWWLEGHESNDVVNRSALEKLDKEILDLLAKSSFKTKFRKEYESIFPADIAEEIQNERKRRFSIIGSLNSSSSFASSPRGSFGDLNRSGSAHSIKGIRDRRKPSNLSARGRCEQDPTSQSGQQVNFSSWASETAPATSAASKKRAGNSLLDAVDRSQAAPSKASRLRKKAATAKANRSRSQG